MTGDDSTGPAGNAQHEQDQLEGSRMPLRQHLEELRRCIFRSFILFVLLFIAGFIFRDWLIDVVMLPYNWARERMIAMGDPDPGTLIIIKPIEGFVFVMKVAGSFAILGGAPYFLFQLWSFVGAGLLDRERKAIFKAFPFAVGLFVVGLLFGFTVLLQLAYPILLSFVSADVATPDITLSEYFFSLRSLTLLMGFVFELPVVMWLVVRAGLIGYETLRSSRKMAFVGILVFAAIMTPPDVVTQVLVAIPMVLLYEVGLLLARRADEQRSA
ncbi:MAG: twin-arginine translocase subunit TatC [Planctomycetota bacterium]|jgi:sec-independent protein translocase protein TatC|nr:twin-arginine translocase subunit TatC [Planctomycetota bacterium]